MWILESVLIISIFGISNQEFRFRKLFLFALFCDLKQKYSNSFKIKGELHKRSTIILSRKTFLILLLDNWLKLFENTKHNFNANK